jgi:hypothetical protein
MFWPKRLQEQFDLTFPSSPTKCTISPHCLWLASKRPRHAKDSSATTFSNGGMYLQHTVTHGCDQPPTPKHEQTTSRLCRNQTFRVLAFFAEWYFSPRRGNVGRLFIVCIVWGRVVFPYELYLLVLIYHVVGLSLGSARRNMKISVRELLEQSGKDNTNGPN